MDGQRKSGHVPGVANVLEEYKAELISTLHKSQEAFEKQLSYISAGSLALSMGFVKDVVRDIHKSGYRGLLMVGWVLMAMTLLMNLVSHLLAARLHSKSIAEINAGTFDSVKSDKRFIPIKRLNWLSVATLIAGILLIIIFVMYNL